MKSKWSLVGATICAFLAPHRIFAHDNRVVHRFSITASSVNIIAPNKYSSYWDLKKYLNEAISDAEGYNYELKVPNTEVCKPGTRGTIEEDFMWLEYNWWPWLEHFWKPWDPQDGPFNAVKYGQSLFDDAVMRFSDGKEEEAFYHFGRCIHVLEDMGSVPHVFNDLHPNIKETIDGNGYENFSFRNFNSLLSSTHVEESTSLVATMESLGRETFRTGRIAGILNRDPENPLDGDLELVFPSTEDSRYVQYHTGDGYETEHWWLRGVGDYHPFEDHVMWELVPWGKIKNLPGEQGDYYYIQRNQEHVIPTHILRDGETTPSPNEQGFSLAQLWVGVEGYRATSDQEHGLIPRTIEHTAGFMKFLWDFINPPPHITGVLITQDKNSDGAIDGQDGEQVLGNDWVEIGQFDATMSSYRLLVNSSDSVASRIPTDIELHFSEPVQRVSVSLGKALPQLTLGEDLISERGPPSIAFPDGEPRILFRNVDLSALPEGRITIFVKAEDLSRHSEPVAAAVDPDPSTRAGRLPDGSWRFVEDGGFFAETDTQHSFRLGGFEIRVNPSGARCRLGDRLTHAIEVRNVSVAAGTPAILGASGSAPGWMTNAESLNSRQFIFSPPSSAWIQTGAVLEVTCTQAILPIVIGNPIITPCGN